MPRFKMIGPLIAADPADNAARFWSFVEKRRKTQCWEWTGHRNEQGYGTMRVTGLRRSVRATRLSYFLHFGEPGERFVCHRCDNPACVNPGHLFLGDAKTNAHDALAKGRGLYIRSESGRTPPEVLTQIKAIPKRTLVPGKYRSEPA